MATTHKLKKDALTRTECGMSVMDGKKTWRGVKCLRCLKARDTQAKAKAKKKGGKK